MCMASFDRLVLLILVLQIFPFASSLRNLTLNNCKENEMKALLEFKENLADPSYMLPSWNGQDCCKWIGVTCSKRTGHVIRLDLRDMFLGGEISRSLLGLKHLSHLDMSTNRFGGAQIPDFLGSLTKLKYLNLSGAYFGGRIPQTLGNLSNLQYLDLNSYYYYDEPMVESDLEWLRSLSSLEYLNLEGVDLHRASSHWLHIINTLPHLSELHLSTCWLVGLPSSLFPVNFTSLSVLDLSSNGFNSTIPKWLFNLTNLRSLYLNDNNLHGALPDAFSELTSLENLDLSVNFAIEGPLPKELGVVCNLRELSLARNRLSGHITEVIDGLSKCPNSSRLEILDLRSNELNGNLPSSLGLLNSLTDLDLMSNSFTGPIPETVGNLTSLKRLGLSYNNMSGSIPESIGQLESMVSLNLYANSWEGVLTEAHFANLSSLQEMWIDSSDTNPLLFNISSDWTPPFKLTYVSIDNCQLGPKFPTFLRNQSDLERLVIPNAGITGVIPDWFLEMDMQLDELDLHGNQLSGRAPSSLPVGHGAGVYMSSNHFSGPLPLWSNVSTLHLDDNELSGPIPEDIGTAMPLLRAIDVSMNYLTGTIPLSISNLTELTDLFISSNYLSGEIHDMWANMRMIQFLDISNNNLSGALPPSLGFLSGVQSLALSHNNLSGQLPFTWMNCTDVFVLDLGDNELSGRIPTWIGVKMTSLKILRLVNNSFTGVIPSDICRLPFLHSLDVSKNSLSGTIPACFGNLSGFKSDFPSYGLLKGYKWRWRGQGRILSYESKHYFVNSIDLSRNNLSGEIPLEITALSRLVVLDLSRNHLTGKIPPNIGGLERLETLDLSNNRLSGTIPPSMVSLTYLNHLNLSYNELSGPIPTGNQFLTLNDPSAYRGNNFSCGIQLQDHCYRGESETTPSPGVKARRTGGGGDELEKLWLYMFVGLGFFLGFWGVCGSLIVKKRWRDAYFDFAESLMSRILDIVWTGGVILCRKLVC